MMLRNLVKSLTVLGCSLLLLSFGFSSDSLKLYQARMDMSFNSEQTPLEVYIFTDWNCPKCKKLESVLSEIAPELLKQARLYFIDLPSQGMENLIGANQTFLLDKNKNLTDYLKQRQELYQIAGRINSPTEGDVKQILEKDGFKYEPVQKEAADLSMKFFTIQAKVFQITKTPTIIVYDLELSKKIGIWEDDMENLPRIRELVKTSIMESEKRNIALKQ